MKYLEQLETESVIKSIKAIVRLNIIGVRNSDKFTAAGKAAP
jgi:hypothetical protein